LRFGYRVGVFVYPVGLRNLAWVHVIDVGCAPLGDLDAHTVGRIWVYEGVRHESEHSQHDDATKQVEVEEIPSGHTSVYPRRPS